MRFPLRAQALGLGLAAVFAIASAPATSRADDGADVADLRAAARKLAGEGIALIDAGKKAEGIERLEAAEAKFHAPTHLLYLARAYRDLGKLGAAADDYERLVGEKLPNYAPDEFREAQRLGALEVSAIAPGLAKIRVVLRGAKRDEATIAIDGKAPKPLLEIALVEPGPHHLALQVGPLERNADVVSTGHDEQTVEVSFVEAPKKSSSGPPPKDKTDHRSPYVAPGIVAFAVGGAGIAVGVATGVVSLGKVSELNKHCPTKNHCAVADEPLANDARTLGNVSTGAFVVGGVGVAAGLLLVLLPAPSTPSNTTRWIRPVVGPGYAGAEGTF